MGSVKVMEWVLAALLAAGLLVLPSVQAQAGGETEDDPYTYLYGHLYTLHRTNSTSGIAIGPNPMNTAFPEGENSFDLNTRYSPFLGAYPTVCAGALADVYACDPVYGATDNEVWFFQYNDQVPFQSTWDYGAAGFLSGLTAGKDLLKDVRLDPTMPVLAEFTMSADQTAWQTLNDEALRGDGGYLPDDVPWPYPAWNLNYGVLPQWTLASKVYAASPGLDATAIVAQEDQPDNVTLIASGASEPFDMVSLPSQLGQITYTLRPDMGAPLVGGIPAGTVTWWWLDWYSHLGGAQVFYGNNFAVYSGEFFPPTLGLPLLNPMDIEMVMPQFTDDNKLVIIALFNSPFGAYDVPLDSASFEIIDPNGQVIATQDDQTITWMQKAAREQQSLLGVSPEAALARGQATWLWNYLAEEDIQAGDYTIRVYAENTQGKAAYKEAFFTIGSGLGAGGVTSSLGGMFTFSKEDIKKLEECHGCHDATTGDLLEGVQNVTMAEAQAMKASEVVGESPVTEKNSPGLGVFALVVAAALLCRRKK